MTNGLSGCVRSHRRVALNHPPMLRVPTTVVGPSVWEFAGFAGQGVITVLPFAL